MKWLLNLICLGAIVWVAGCPAPSEADRLSVTPALRRACDPVPDSYIFDYLQDVEAARVEGVPYETAKAASDELCFGDTDCMLCGYACVDQVYGR